MAAFHQRKKRILGGHAGQWLGLITLGFASIYREGFETVLFLQALTLEGDVMVVLVGVALGLAGTLLVGLAVFVMQAKLPHKKMLIVTGILIGAVLLQMVGKTVNVLQVIGWLPLHPIRWAGVAVLDGILVRVVSDVGRDRVAGCGSYLRYRQLLSGGIYATTATSGRAGIGDGAARLKSWSRDNDCYRVQ